ncbi:hypothetical protein A2U01_0027319 [Trifolium medium]|uniref:Uncharacterized protein n=1 Tax=Trifolium medium TaxID=97028 RepID=A0A392P2H7_9FABA|nr:hypothetical protein [Trifolium medium]
MGVWWTGGGGVIAVIPRQHFIGGVGFVWTGATTVIVAVFCSCSGD